VLNAKTPADAPAAVGAALHYALSQQGKLAATILWPYTDDLAVFGGWWRQLWAESLGKNGQGSTPVSVLGSGGPAQPAAVVPRRAGQCPLHPDDGGHQGQRPCRAARPRQCAGAPVSGPAESWAIWWMRKPAPPPRPCSRMAARCGRIHLAKVDEFHMGALMMHFMLETIVMGRLMGVDPFDQPGVEEGKVLARQYLAEG